MKIISLTMNAFMTYKEKTVIHFDELMNHGLYLISGPTGSGKTTIFDAMTFALYGVASGSHRQQAYFRSDFAEAKEETYVEMTFALHQQVYTVRRSPTYTRVGYKTPKMANAWLSFDGKMIEGVKEVNQKINELLGVDVHQFKQIVMIAQGEFTKLIYASSEEREKVLRHIFHSETLVAFENLLKDEVRQCREDYLVSSHNLQSKFQLLSLSDTFQKEHDQDFHPSYIEESIEENQRLYEKVMNVKKQYDVIKEKYEKNSKEYYEKQKQNQDLLEYQNLKKQYEQFILSKDEMLLVKKDIHQLRVIEQNQSLIDQYHQTQQEFLFNQNQLKDIALKQRQLEDEIITINQKYSQLPELKKQKDQLLLDIEEIKQSLQQQQYYSSLLQKMQDLKKQHEKKKKQYQQDSQHHQKYAKRIERDQENVSQLPVLELELQQNEQLVKEMNQRRVSIHDLSELYDRYTQGQDKHFELSQVYQKKDKDYQKTLHLYQQEDENFKRQQAGILALSLEENQPCPVCGSLDHPHPAHLATRVLSSNELEELNRRTEKLKIDKEESYQDVLSQNNFIHEILVKINIIKKQLGIEEELSKEVFIRLLSNITQVTKKQEKTYQKRHNEVDYLKKVKKSLERDYALFEQQSQQLDQQQNDIHDLEKQMIACQTHLHELENQYQLLRKENLAEECDILINQFKQLNEKMTDIEMTYHHAHQELTALQKQYEMTQERNQKLEASYQKLQQDFHQFIQTYFETQENFQHFVSMKQDLQQKEDIYQNYIIQEKTLTASLKKMEKTCQNYTLHDLTQQLQQLQQQEQQRDLVLKDYHACLQAYTKNQDIIKQLQKDYQKNQDIFEKYTIYQDLYDMTSGKNGLKMSFERYILSSYFEHILEYANIELWKMSQGRFALYRKQSVKGSKQQGLELSVLDYETGILRDVQSLSGGESFKAALSLALGLSSMIQSYAGGIELNTLFIDEGFGTLDNESIDQALSVLMDLRNDHKVIGIISHVDELKERIPTQILVEKGQKGSYLHVEKE